MIVAVASGKGGTGKTTLTASLVATWTGPVVAVDLDVEEPNLHLFLQPRLEHTETVFADVPVVDKGKCDLCRQCAELCQFKAITVMGQTILTFPEMCHACGGCQAICPQGAITWTGRELGVLETGRRQEILCLTGRLRVGEAMSPPLMRHVRAAARQLAEGKADIIIDAPPGVSCPAMTAVADCDVLVLVTEPTPFGFYDFTLAFEAFSPLAKPLAVVVNRDGLGDERVFAFCAEHNLPVLARIPYRLDIARHYAQGRILAEMDAELGAQFRHLGQALRTMHRESAHA